MGGVLPAGVHIHGVVSGASTPGLERGKKPMNDEIRKENDRKKLFLWSYQDAIRDVSRLEIRLREVKQMRIIPAFVADGMPHGSGGTGDLSGYAAQLDSLERRYLKARYRRIRQLKAVTDRIEALTEQREKDVLTYRYILDMGWEEISVKMKYSWQHVHRIHASALRNLKM